MPHIHSITPCLWFDTQAEEAARYYTSIFDDSRIGTIVHYTKAGQEVHGKTPGSVMTVAFELDGHPFTAVNGGPHFQFNEAISLQVMCESQAEIDYFWETLSQGGDEQAQVCGWLKDKFGMSWQIVPQVLSAMLCGSDPEAAERVMTALMKMTKLDLAQLQAAYAGKSTVEEG